MGRFRDRRIDDPTWANDFESYRRFYNAPKPSNYLSPETSPLLYPRLEFAKLLARGRVLDVGCNGGKFDFVLARRGLSGVAVDISQTYIAENQQLLSQEPPDVRARLSFRVMAAEEVEFSAEFDTVMIFELLEHVIDPLDVMHRCARALKPDGIGLASSWGATMAPPCRGLPPSFPRISWPTITSWTAWRRSASTNPRTPRRSP